MCHNHDGRCEMLGPQQQRAAGVRGHSQAWSGLDYSGAALPYVDLSTRRTAVSITAGDQHTCAVLDEGGLKVDRLKALVAGYRWEKSVSCDSCMRPLNPHSQPPMSVRRLVIGETPCPLPSVSLPHTLRVNPPISPMPAEWMPAGHSGRTGQLGSPSAVARCISSTRYWL